MHTGEEAGRDATHTGEGPGGMPYIQVKRLEEMPHTQVKGLEGCHTHR